MSLSGVGPVDVLLDKALTTDECRPVVVGGDHYSGCQERGNSGWAGVLARLKCDESLCMQITSAVVMAAVIAKQ